MAWLGHRDSAMIRVYYHMADEDAQRQMQSQPTAAQRAWLACGLRQPGGKLPLFDTEGRKVDPRTIRACIDQGWAEQWFANPLKPDWLVCRLTEAGRAIVSGT